MGWPPDLDLELVEDQAVLDLLWLPDVRVEVAVDLRRVRQHRGQLEDVAVDLQLHARHVVEHVAESLPQEIGPLHGEVDGAQLDGRVLGGQTVDVLDQSHLGRGAR